MAKRKTESVVIDASVFADHHILYPRRLRDIGELDSS